MAKPRFRLREEVRIVQCLKITAAAITRRFKLPQSLVPSVDGNPPQGNTSVTLPWTCTGRACPESFRNFPEIVSAGNFPEMQLSEG